MNDLNQVLLEGRLVRDPVARQLESGALVCTFTVASNTRYVNKTTGQVVNKAIFLLVETWQNVAEACASYLSKGDAVRVIGQIKQSHWMREKRIKMEKTFISAEHVEFKDKSKIFENHTEEEVVEDLTQHVKSEGEEPSEAEQAEIEEEVINISEEQ